MGQNLHCRWCIGPSIVLVWCTTGPFDPVSSRWPFWFVRGTRPSIVKILWPLDHCHIIIAVGGCRPLNSVRWSGAQQTAVRAALRLSVRISPSLHKRSGAHQTSPDRQTTQGMFYTVSKLSVRCASDRSGASLIRTLKYFWPSLLVLNLAGLEGLPMT